MDQTNKIYGHNGLDMYENKLNEYNKYFDWICFEKTILKQKPNPKTIYLKSCFLNTHLSELTKVKDYIIFCCCADHSIQYNENFNKILEVCKIAFIENKIKKHTKVNALTVGYATHSPYMEKVLLNTPKNTCKKKRILCMWRERESPERLKAKEWIKDNPVCDFFPEDKGGWEFFIEKVNEYKFVLCPTGFGNDPAPRIFEVMALGSIPICFKTLNSYELYQNYPIMWINQFDDINLDFETDKKFDLEIDLSIDNYISKLIYSI